MKASSRGLLLCRWGSDGLSRPPAGLHFAKGAFCVRIAPPSWLGRNFFSSRFRQFVTLLISKRTCPHEPL
jgi:hypothetical protein